MRILDPVLQDAMDSGNFTPIVRAAVLDPDDYSVQQYLDLVYFKINGLDIDIEFYDPSGTFSDSVSLERGALINGVEYTIFSGIYHLTRSFKVRGGKKGLYSATGSLVEPSAVNVAADAAYSTVIANVLALGTCTASYKTPGAAWLTYQFLADGQFFHTSNIYTFFTILRQKYLIYPAENGPDDILFFSVADSLALASQYTLRLTDRDTWSISSNYRQFIWKDEAGTTHQPGPAAYPIHNLGYLESTAEAPTVPDNNLPVGDIVMTVIPNLKYQSGDCVKFDPVIGGYSPVKSVLDVTEIFDSRKKSNEGPAWRMELRPLRYFSPTEAGQIDRSDQYTTTYAPLATSGFTGLLDEHVTNLQSFADAVDKLPVVSSVFLHLSVAAGKVLTLAAADDFILTVPATGTAALLGIANVFTANQFIDGSIDQIQLRVQGYSTQTNFLQSWENSTATILASISNMGNWGIGTTPDSHMKMKLDYVIESGAYENFIGTQYNIQPVVPISQGTALRGVFYAVHSGVIYYARGLNFQVLNGSGGNIDVAQAINLDIQNYGSGAIWHATVININSITSGNISDLIGLYIGNLTACTPAYSIYTNAGLNRFGDQVSVIGSADRIQSLIKGYSSQTANLQEWQNSSGIVLSCVDKSGQFGVGTATPGAMLQVLNNNADQIGLLIQGASSQVENLFEIQDNSENFLVKVAADGVFFPFQKSTSSAPTYVKGGMYFDLTLKKLRIGGASAWETITSV